jgi:hypothetical protein
MPEIALERNLDYLASKYAHELVRMFINPADNFIKLEYTPRGKQEPVTILAKDVENLLTKALGICQENGLYAAVLFLLSRSGMATEKEQTDDRDEVIATQAVATIMSLINSPELETMQLLSTEVLGQIGDISRGKGFTFQQVNNHKPGILKSIEGICADLENLLLLKPIVEQMLIYARFNAKALKKD